MKKIIFFSVNMNIGGMEKALVDLLNELAKKNYDVTLVLEKKEGVLLRQIDRRITVREYRVCTGGNVLMRKVRNFLHRAVWTAANRGKYDFSCAYATYSVIGTRLALAASANSSIYIHSNYFDVYRGQREEIRRFFDELRLEDFRHIIFVSNESRDKLKRVYPCIEEKGAVIDNLIDADKIWKLSADKVPLKKEGERTFLFVGRLEEESKRLSRLLNAFAAAYQKDRGIRLFIIGEGKDKELCRRLIHELRLEEAVSMLGKKENPYPYIKEADCVLLTSDYEGYPVIYSECLILQTPVITTVPVSDGFVDIRDYEVIVEKDENAVANAILITDLQQYGRNKIDFKELNRKKLESLERLFSSI